MSEPCKSRRLPRLPRMAAFTIITLVLLLALASIRPEQLQVVLYKSGLVTLGAVLGYWIDRHLFPRARPTECRDILLVGVAYLRRALIVLACVLGLTLGL